MRVKSGEFVKEIPARYERAVELLTFADWEKPEKIRLTEMERFRFAEAAWRVEQAPEVQRYLENRKPEQVVIQTNRMGEQRGVVRYEERNGVCAHAIVPRWVWVVCPLDLFSYQDINWHT
jgi:hypothetical protein